MYHTTTRAHRVLMAVLTEMNRQVMSVESLAELWGVEPEWAIGRLSGKKGLTGSELGHIARALGVPVEQLDNSAIRQIDAWEQVKHANPDCRADALFLVETGANGLGY